MQMLIRSYRMLYEMYRFGVGVSKMLLELQCCSFKLTKLCTDLSCVSLVCIYIYIYICIRITTRTVRLCAVQSRVQRCYRGLSVMCKFSIGVGAIA